MMTAALAALALALPAQAARQADVAATLSLPAAFDVEVADTVTVTVDNVGRRNAQNVEVVIDLPETNTSPMVHIMGSVSNVDSACSLTDTTLTCSLGRIRRGRSDSVTFDIALPVSEGSLDFVATASTTSTDADAGNDADSDSASMIYVDTVITGPVDVEQRHCTGVGLESFAECEYYPSSISSHLATFEANGSISFSYAGYSGSWEQDTDDHLRFEYTYNGQVVAEFEGFGVGNDCFEGLTLFPGSAYNAPYETCLQ